MDKLDVFTIMERITELSTADELIEEIKILLTDLLKPDTLAIYRLSKSRLYTKSRSYQTSAVDLLDLESESFIVDEIIDMHTCMEDKKKTEVEADDYRLQQYYYPIVENFEVTHIIKISYSNSYNEMNSEIDHLIKICSNQLIILNDKYRDFLTGLHNRQYYNRLIGTICNPITNAKKRNPKHCYSHLAMIDIDHFKKVNDTYGHLIGDEVLIHLADLIKEIFRRDDFKLRYGGEEFCILVKKVEDDKICELLDRFRSEVEDHDFPRINNMTVSIGYCKIESESNPLSVSNNADKALYYAKDHGRNSVCSYDKLLAENKIENVKSKDVDITLWKL